MGNQILTGVSITTGTYTAIVDKVFNLSNMNTGSYVCLLNVHMLVLAQMDRKFKEVLKCANITTSDGMAITWALRLLNGVKQERVPGMDILPDLLSKAETCQKSVFFYGSTQQMLLATEHYLKKNYPGLKISGLYSPPFRELTENEKIKIADTINQSGAELVFVILGCPKQEKWMASMKDKINGVMVGVGGALSVMIGFQRRAPKWMQQSGLEWLFRLAQEPRRLFKRYLSTNTLFVFIVLKEYTKMKLLLIQNLFKSDNSDASKKSADESISVTN